MDIENRKILGIKEPYFIVLLFLISLILRVAYTIILRVYFHQGIINDELRYHELALGLLNNGFYGLSSGDRAFYTPGYPIFLYAIYNFYGTSILLAGFFNCLFSSLIPPMIYLLGNHLTQGQKASALAGIIAVFDPYFIYYSPLLLTETLITFLPLLSILFLFMALKRDSYLHLIISSLIMGISTLVKPVTLLFPLILIIYLALAKDFFFKKALKQSLLYLAFFALVISPWILRNYHVFGVPLVTTSKVGRIFVGGNHFLPGRNNANMGMYEFDTRNIINNYVKCPDYRTELSLDKAFFNAGIAELKKNYLKTPYLLLKKFINFWGIRPDPSKEKWTLNDSLSLFSYGIILLFFAIGFFKTFKIHDKIFILHLMIILNTTLALVFWGTPRFRFPVSPYIIIIASMVIVAVWESYMSKLRTNHKNI